MRIGLGMENTTTHHIPDTADNAERGVPMGTERQHTYAADWKGHV